MAFVPGPAWIGLALAVAAGPALAMSWDLPQGRYEREAAPGELKQVQVLPKKGLRLIFAPGREHALAVVEAKYKMTAQKFSDYNVTAEVRSVSLGKRRVKQLERMGVAMSPGRKLSFTTSFHCAGGHEQVQFCLHAEIDGKPHVVCHELSDPSTTCQPPPPGPPGYLINQPAKDAVVNDDKDPGG